MTLCELSLLKALLYHQHNAMNSGIIITEFYFATLFILDNCEIFLKPLFIKIKISIIQV